MKKLIIIRSVSFQQLDLNLKAIKEKYPDHEISILTHEHGVKLAEKYKDIEKIYVYPYKSGFQSGNKVKEIENVKFDVVIVPVANLSGAGFFNVLKYSLTFKTDKIVMCNLVSDLKDMTRTSIYLLEASNFLFKVVSGIFTGIVSIIFIPFLFLKLKGGKK